LISDSGEEWAAEFERCSGFDALLEVLEEVLMKAEYYERVWLCGGSVGGENVSGNESEIGSGSENENEIENENEKENVKVNENEEESEKTNNTKPAINKKDQKRDQGSATSDMTWENEFECPKKKTYQKYIRIINEIVEVFVMSSLSTRFMVLMCVCEVFSLHKVYGVDVCDV
jgi:hypothetical protein